MSLSCNDFLPLPDLFACSPILCIQPHPDDMEIGVGATVARLTDRGLAVICLTVTDGSAGTADARASGAKLAQTRRREAEQSARILGIKELVRLDFADGGELSYREVRAAITRVIRSKRPQAVMVCDPWLPYEAHSDHRCTGLAAAEASFLANMPAFCPEDLADDLEPHTVEAIAFYYTAYPNTYIDVTETWNRKLSAIACHQSQFSPEKMEELQVLLHRKALYYAGSLEYDLAEALKVLSTEHLHIIEEAWRC